MLEEINVTLEAGWDNALTHFNIDDDLQVQNLILSRLNQFLLQR